MGMKELKTCTIELPGKNDIVIETYLSNNKRAYGVRYGEHGDKLKFNNNDKVFKFFCSGDESPSIKIYRTGVFSYKYFVGFDDVKMIVLAIAITVGIDVISHQ